MSLPRKELRVYFDQDDYEALTELSNLDRRERIELVEEIVVKAVWKRIHDARILADKTKHLRTSRSDAESTPETDSKS